MIVTMSCRGLEAGTLATVKSTDAYERTALVAIYNKAARGSALLHLPQDVLQHAPSQNEVGSR